MSEHPRLWTGPPAEVCLDREGRANAPRFFCPARTSVRALAAQPSGLSPQPSQPCDSYPDRESRRPDVAVPASRLLDPLADLGPPLGDASALHPMTGSRLLA